MTPGPRSHFLIARLAASLRPQFHYLEIGVCEGVATQHIYAHCDIGFGVLIDNWSTSCGGTGRGNCQHIVDMLGMLMDKTIILTGDSKVILPTISHKFDLIFLDGDHSTEGCLADLNNSIKLLDKYGILVVDDIDNPAHTYLRGVTHDFAIANNLSADWYPEEHYGIAVLKHRS